MNDDQNKKEVVDQEEINNPGLTKKQEKALRRKEFFKSHPKLEWFYNHMTLTAILSFFFVLFVVFFFRGCTEDTTKYNSSIQNNNSSLVESNVKRAVGWNDEHTYYESYNIWDEEWELGSISTSNGGNVSSYTKIRSKNFISVVPSTAYFLYQSIAFSDTDYIYFYDTDKQFINYQNFYHDTTINFEFTTPSSCEYIKFIVKGTTYNYDICINVSDERINGLYFPGGNLYPQREYDELLASYNTLQENYNNLVTSHNELQNEYDTLTTNYNTLNSDYEALQTSYNALQTQYNNLQTLYDNLRATFNELNGSNAFEYSNLDRLVFVTTDGTTNRFPNLESNFLGSSLPLYRNADEVRYNYNTPVYFKQGTIVGISTTYTYTHPVAVKVSFYDSDNSLIGDFGITFSFTTASQTGVYAGSYEFVSDVGNISSIVFTDLSLNGSLGVTTFELASDPYKRGYNNGYLARSDDYYEMLNNYNNEVEKYNALYDEYQEYKSRYNSAVVASARAAGIEEGANADNALSDGFLAVFNAPFALTYRLLDFNILGLNMWVLAVSLASIVVLVKLVKVVL